MNEDSPGSQMSRTAVRRPETAKLHVAESGRSGSSAAFEYLRERAAIRTVSAGQDGETCTSVKQVNPVGFSARCPSVGVGPTEVVHLLTGGRLLSFDTSKGQFSATNAIHSESNSLVKDYLAAHPRYNLMNTEVLVDIDEDRMLHAASQHIGSSSPLRSHTTTRRVLRSLATTEWPDGQQRLPSSAGASRSSPTSRSAR